MSEDNALAWPLVSVIVPTQHRPLLLRRAVSSVLGQDYPGPIECLVVFDRSKPAVPPVETGKNRVLRILTNERTSGPPGTRNTGAMDARGEFLAFCDDDDEWLERKLRLQIDALRANQSAKVATCGIYVCYSRRAITRLPPDRTLTFKDFLRSRHMEVHPSTLVVGRKTFLEYIGPLDEDIPPGYCEDYEWILRASRSSRLVAVREPLVRVHWHSGSWSMMQGTERWQTVIAALTYLIEKYPEFQEEPEGLARICGQIAFSHAALGEKAQSRQWATKCISLNPLELRGYLALLVNSRLIRWETILQLVHLLGRGIV